MAQDLHFLVSDREEIARLDQNSFFSAEEHELFRDKGELGPMTRLGNLLVKKSLCDLLGVSLEEGAGKMEIRRRTLQGFGYGRPYAVFSADLAQAWWDKFQGYPDIGLSHHGDKFAFAVWVNARKTPGESPAFPRVGIDIMAMDTVTQAYRRGDLMPYLTAWERQFIEKIPIAEKRDELVLAGWCVKEAVFKAVDSDQMRGAHNRMPFIEVKPQKKIEGFWSVAILENDEPVRSKEKWYPKLKDLLLDERIDRNRIEATYQNVGEYGLALVTLHEISGSTH